MAFWGIEVRPGKPYTHSFDRSRGRLRISQATLGDGKGTAKSVLQCNVGDKSPILLCNLIPNVSESCHLELEFEEADDVVFSVLGQKSVHLSGFYLGSGGNGGGEDSDESYGEDIAETESEDMENLYNSEDDEYESDFIDDDDVEMFASSRRKSNVVIKEIFEEDDKPQNGNAGRRRLKKNREISDSDDEDDVGSQRQLVVKGSSPKLLESEDEDGFPISFSMMQKSPVKKAEVNENPDQKSCVVKKRKIDTMADDAELKRKSSEPIDSSVPSDIEPESNEKPKKKKKVKGKKSLQTDEGQLVEGKMEKKDNDLAAGANVDESVDGGIVKKKKKENKKVENSEVVNGVSADGPEEGGKKEPAEGKPKAADDMGEDLPDAVEQELSVDKNNAKRKKNKKKIQQTEENANSNEELPKNADIHDQPAVADEKETKKKKKRNKNHDNDPNNDVASKLSVAEEKQGGAGRNAKTYPNGLTVEELSMGKPDGKRASPGTKVAVNYIGKLKNGKIFDSTTGGKPFKFRLGIGQVIKGWDVGINGMRVGDKRKLTIPPSMGYGNKNIGQIPANSWLIFDVELVSVN
ncbi:peptidyl-prolyl cis-trans isomerase FKBP53 [Dioscorea cayenensis subsp. rotundata]|uniref:peptidylprolyl isomerase n=1 Tax=Dioscorea cayennensis subsp. rotundata TaxID=55577 RepID=A0AB40BMA0_DIOCR|nr:peptidyl-prolyl cis-trans isomerase FKBP53 [Dioscorea cayenensis subsp. rotundata]